MHTLNLISGNRSCSHTSLVPWLLMQEHGIDFQDIRIDLFRSDAIEQLGLYSPSLQVPVLIHEDVKVWDALPICEYLSETFLEQRGWPRHLKKRAAARSFRAELHADFGHFHQQWPLTCEPVLSRKPDARLEREIARLDAIMYCCRGKFGDGGPWLFGDFSIADAFMAPYAITLNARNAEMTEKSRAYMATLLDHPAVLGWLHEARGERVRHHYALTG